MILPEEPAPLLAPPPRLTTGQCTVANLLRALGGRRCEAARSFISASGSAERATWCPVVASLSTNAIPATLFSRPIGVTTDSRGKEGHMKITVETKVAAPVEEVWRAWTTPEDIKQW